MSVDVVGRGKYCTAIWVIRIVFKPADFLGVLYTHTHHVHALESDSQTVDTERAEQSL